MKSYSSHYERNPTFLLRRARPLPFRKYAGTAWRGTAGPGSFVNAPTYPQPRGPAPGEQTGVRTQALCSGRKCVPPLSPESGPHHIALVSRPRSERVRCVGESDFHTRRDLTAIAGAGAGGEGARQRGSPAAREPRPRGVTGPRDACGALSRREGEASVKRTTDFDECAENNGNYATNLFHIGHVLRW